MVSRRVSFWLGEAPGRTNEVSQAVSRFRAEAENTIEEALNGNGTQPAENLRRWLAKGSSSPTLALASWRITSSPIYHSLGVIPSTEARSRTLL